MKLPHFEYEAPGTLDARTQGDDSHSDGDGQQRPPLSLPGDGFVADGVTEVHYEHDGADQVEHAHQAEDGQQQASGGESHPDGGGARDERPDDARKRPSDRLPQLTAIS